MTRGSRAWTLAAGVATATVTAVMSGACAGPRFVIRADVKPAPLDVEVARLPHARGYFMTDAEYGGQLYVIVAGPPPGRGVPTLVMVHGLGDAGVRDFYPLLPALTRERPVVAFDLPGFGRSTRANLKYTPERYAHVLSQIIAAFADGPVDVMGHSMGGAIALLHAATYPAEVRRLVVADAAGILHREAWLGQHLRRVTDPTGRVFPGVAAAMVDAAAAVVDATRPFGAGPELILELGTLRERLLGGDPGRIAALSLILYDFGPALSRIEAPTLILWGADDVIAPVRTGQLLSDRLRDARLVIIPGAGHGVMAEAPAPLLDAIARHLGDGGSLRGPRPGDAVAATTEAAPPSAASASRGDAACSRSTDMHFAGVYDTLTLDDCARATLDGVRARRLVLRRSTASVVRSTFSEGIAADASTLLMTGGSADGAIAMDVTDSQVDLAGVTLESTAEAYSAAPPDTVPYRMSGESRILFSVCLVRTPAGLATRHGFVSSAPAP